ncbi:MAG: hypothetical protein KKB13_00375 [Chloroflexi bacterium]|nr:hypothetical protein [Chloroflexota bacterium]
MSRRALRPIDRRVYLALRAEQPTAPDRGLIRGYLPDLVAEHDRQQTAEALAQALVALARPQPGERVLEPCCGPGEFLPYLAATGATLVALEGAYLLARAARALHPTVRVHHLDLLDAWHWADGYATQRGALDVLAGGFDLVLGALPATSGPVPPTGGLGLGLSERPTALPAGEEIPLAAAYLEVVLRLLKPGGRAALLLPGPLNGWWARLYQDSLGPLALVGEVLVPGALEPARQRQLPRVWLIRRADLPAWTTRRAKLDSLTPPPDLRRLLAAS